MIYYVGCFAANAVKIGIVTSGAYPGMPPVAQGFARLGTLQVGCPFPLELLALCEGGRADELELHMKFADARLRGEWFTITDDLRRHISQFPKPVRPPRRVRGQTAKRAA